MHGPRWRHGFTDVDARPDPARWIEVLDKVRREPPYAAYKQRVLELLDLRPEGDYLEVGTGADALAAAARFRARVVEWTRMLRTEEIPIVLHDPTALDNAMGLRDWAGFAHEQGLVEAGEVAAWQAALDEAPAAGRFLYSFSIFVTGGRRPQTA